MTIYPLTIAHWNQVKGIYEQGIASGDATFQTDVPSWKEWHQTCLPHSRLVAVDEGYGQSNQVLGWAALAPISGRAVYQGVADVQVYVAGFARGRGVGRQLLEALVSESEAHGMWLLQASVFPENTTTISIYAGAGFREVGHRERMGQLHGVWRSVVLLERRSAVVGVEVSPLISPVPKTYATL
ncbi:GNAT family N-acetyltransferase [Hymenobacter sp. DH14]|uniref:GNAT family N-acetyltransferase n=1 Tax=Hymenobacter cyanobacteriorum TaxID=2926463 RepID=A0A9X1VPI6_9BACT|nr:GNAT family N-acetyltransferase [Hymenobacter cyanobacteriorum]MCI1189671.1 GNAT family N-acetyltransferase [Hymenobacter cyanobacteriorum]